MCPSTDIYIYPRCCSILNCFSHSNSTFVCWPFPFPMISVTEDGSGIRINRTTLFVNYFARYQFFRTFFVGKTVVFTGAHGRCLRPACLNRNDRGAVGYGF